MDDMDDIENKTTKPEPVPEPELVDNNTESCYENWDDFNLKPELLRGIFAYGYEKPSDIQKKSIPLIVKGKDVIAQAQSGMGKTGAFSISILEKINTNEPTLQALLMAPTHELAKQTSNVLKSLGSLFPNLCVKTLIGGTSIQEDAQSIQQTCPHIVVGCAGRIYDMFRRKYINGKDMKIMVLDEADEMLSSGFKEQIYNIFQYMNENIQVVLFSATLPTEIMSLTSKFMREPEKIMIDAEKLNLECIKQYYIAMRNDSDKYDTLKDLFSYISVSQCIIYCNSVKRVVDLHKAMVDEGFSVCCIHSMMNKTERDQEFSNFRNGAHRVLISSDITARGIDIQQVSSVINFDITKCPYTYLHRIGRSGRWGRKGLAINFITRQDVPILKKIEKYYKINMEELPSNFSSNDL